jgi:hypothetical protein
VGPSCVGWATTFAMKTYQEAQCELAASEQVILHPGTTLAKGSNAWVHLVPITQALANEMSPSASIFLTHTSA